MAAMTIWLPVSYKVSGRIGASRKVETLKVCETLPFLVQEACAHDLPVAFRVSCPILGDDALDARIGQREGRLAQPGPMDVRRLGDGFLCPVYGIGGAVPLSVEGIGASVAVIEDRRSEAIQARGIGRPPHILQVERCPVWQGQPLGSPGRGSFSDAWPRAMLDMRSIVRDERDDAIGDARARMAASRIVDGVLWRPCGPPVWALSRNFNGDSLRVIVPGHDTLDPWVPIVTRDNVRAAGKNGVPFAFAPACIPVETVLATLGGACPERAVEVSGDVSCDVHAPVPAGESMRALGREWSLDGDIKWNDVPQPMRLPRAMVEDLACRHVAGAIAAIDAWTGSLAALETLAERMGDAPAPPTREGGREFDVARATLAMAELGRRHMMALVDAMDEVDSEVLSFSP